MYQYRKGLQEILEIWGVQKGESMEDGETATSVIGFMSAARFKKGFYAVLGR